MKKERNPIGGEFWREDYLQDYSIYNAVENEGILLSGGKSAIEFILEKLNFNKGEIIAIPSYLCPTIIKFIENKKVDYKFYNVNLDLTIDVKDLERVIGEGGVKAVLFINYFGFFHEEYEKSFLKSLKSKNIVLIEDGVQNFWIKREMEFIGDYIFNSYRKFLPIDGSLVLCEDNYSAIEIRDRYFNLMEKAREEKKKFILCDHNSEEKFLELFEEAHKAYYERRDVYGINREYKEFLNHLPVDRLIERRRENYNYLLDKFYKINEIKPLFSSRDVSKNIPLFLPIVSKNRDYVKRQLMKEHIYAPIHWDLRKEAWAYNFHSSMALSSSVLSIPIDWRYDMSDMEYIAKQLKKIINGS